jgi:NitT/TauT family transport system substrate-binding protein
MVPMRSENGPMQNPGVPRKTFWSPALYRASRFAAARFIIACAVTGNTLAGRAAIAQTLDKVSFATNWVAEAEHGGFYQALADGTYRRHGLDVTIIPGGPQVNNRILLPAGKIDFYLSANTLQSFDAVEQNIPTLVVASMFQKDPQVLIAHPDRGINDLKDLKGLVLYVSKEGMASYFQWLKADYGLVDGQVKPYTFNPQPFLADRNSVMQGYVTSEPYAIEKETGMKPKIFLIADYGFSSYSTLIETRRDLVEMTDELLASSVARMKEYGIVDSGDALELGIGAMTDARMANFFDKMARAGVVKANLDYRKSYTLRFVNRKVGLELRRN